MVLRFLDFCNTYSAVIDLAIAFFSLLLSGIAIYVSIRTAELPYRKKLNVKSNKTYQITDLGKKSLYGYHVTVTSIGGRPVVLTMVGLCFSGSKKVHITKDSIPSPGKDFLCKLEQGDVISKEFDLKTIVMQIGKHHFSDWTTVYGFAEDSEAKRYKVRIGKVRYIRKLRFDEVPMETITE